MKTYNEMTENVFKRINEYEADKARKRKTALRTAVPVCCLAAAALVGVTVWKNNGGKAVQKPETESSQITESVSSETDSNSDGKKIAFIQNDMLGFVIADGHEYLQDLTDDLIDEAYTADRYLGDARDFEGTYNKKYNDMSAELYSVKESKNVLLVKLENGSIVVLVRAGELCVDGKDYYFYGELHGETKGKSLGKAERYIIDVPTRQNNIEPQDEIWTVDGDSDKLIAEKPDGTQSVYFITNETQSVHFKTSCKNNG